MKQRFEVVGVEVHSYDTDFSIKNLDYPNSENKMSSQAFFHHLGALCGRRLTDIEGLVFTVELPIDPSDSCVDESLDLCGKTIGSK